MCNSPNKRILSDKDGKMEVYIASTGNVPSNVEQKPIPILYNNLCMSGFVMLNDMLSYTALEIFGSIRAVDSTKTLNFHQRPTFAVRSSGR